VGKCYASNSTPDILLGDTTQMELLAIRDAKQIWFNEISRSYRFDVPFAGELYVCILFANDETITNEEQAAVSEQLVRTGCRYAVCAGYECSSWDTSVDTAYIATDRSLADETFVMTSWHQGKSVEDVISFGLMCTDFDEHSSFGISFSWLANAPVCAMRS
jgi:hypothetical protein